MTHPPLQPSVVYHIYNRGNNGENIFIEERNYAYFLGLYAKYIYPISDTFAYCLLKNHFHIMLRIKDWQSLEDCQSYPPWHAFANLFSTYTKAINNAYPRTGSLFEKPFKRKPVTDDRYFRMLIAYIHQNPQKHGFVDDYRDWPYSSYQAILGVGPTRLARDETLEWFDGREGFISFHEQISSFKLIVSLIEDDQD